VESHAVGGAVVFELYAVATLVLLLTQWLSARAAMLWGLALLIPALALLVVASDAPSLPLLLIGAAVGGAAAALGYRGSLQLVPVDDVERRRQRGAHEREHEHKGHAESGGLVAQLEPGAGALAVFQL